jgi:hypothetical protein
LYSEFFLSLLIATFSVVWRFCNVAVIGSSSLVTNNVYRVTLTSFKKSYVFRIYSKVFCRLLPQLTYISSEKQKRFQVQTIFFFSFSNFSYQHYRFICSYSLTKSFVPIKSAVVSKNANNKELYLLC